MVRSFRWTTRILVGAACGMLVGCQTTSESMSHPGNLPSPLGEQTVASSQSVQINATTYFAHAHLLERQGHFARARDQYEKALKLKPDFVSAKNRLGITLNKLGEHALATQQFQQAIGLEAGQAYLYNNLGFSQFLEGDFRAALSAFQQALDLNPAFDRARVNYAMTLAKLGSFDDALGEFRLVLGEADACYNMGVLMGEAGRFGDAAEFFEAAIAANPEMKAAHIQLREVARTAAKSEASLAASTSISAPSPTRKPVQASVPPAMARTAPNIQSGSVEVIDVTDRAPVAVAAPIASKSVDSTPPRAPVPSPVVAMEIQMTDSAPMTISSTTASDTAPTASKRAGLIEVIDVVDSAPSSTPSPSTPTVAESTTLPAAPTPTAKVSAAPQAAAAQLASEVVVVDIVETKSADPSPTVVKQPAESKPAPKPQVKPEAPKATAGVEKVEVVEVAESKKSAEPIESPASN